MTLCVQCGVERDESAFRGCIRCAGCRGRYLIYALVDPCSGLPRYVGKSSSGIARPNQHVKSAASEHTYKARWICGLLALGLSPRVEILERCAEASGLSDAERKWISEFRSRGHALTNLTDGGDGLLGYKQSPETIEKRVAPRRGVAMSVEQRARLSVARKGIRPSAATRAKIAASMLGRVMSAEAIEKSAAKRRGRKMSPEFCEKNRQAHLLQTFSADHRRKISQACRGIPKSAEWRARMSAIRREMPESIRCRKHTPENRAAMVDAHRRRAETETAA